MRSHLARPTVSLEALEPRVLLNGAYEVWAGNTDLSASPNQLLNVDQQAGYTKLGESSTPNSTGAFSAGSTVYQYFVIATRAFVDIDTVQGNTGYVSSVYASYNASNLTKIGGAPDGASAHMGASGQDSSFNSYVVIKNPGTWTSLNVYAKSMCVATSASFSQEADYVPGATSPYGCYMSLDVNDNAFITGAKVQAPSGVWCKLGVDSGSTPGQQSDWNNTNSQDQTTIAAVEAEFGAGNYTLVLSSPLGTVTTVIPFVKAGTTTAITQPTQIPVITSQTMGQTNASIGGLFTWQPVTDTADINAISVHLDAQGNRVFGQVLSASATGVGPNALTLDTNYDLELDFQHAFSATTAQGIHYQVDKKNNIELYFRTAGNVTATADLVAQPISFPALTYSPGDSMMATGGIKNVGTLFASSKAPGTVGPVVVKVALSTDKVWGNADDRVVMMESDAGWDAGDGGSGTAVFTIPTNLAAGKYYVGMMVDTTNVVAESNKANDLVWAATQVTVAAPTAWTTIGTGDVNGDGHQDLLTRDGLGQIRAIMQISDMRSTTLPVRIIGGVLPTTTTWSKILIGDVNGDGMSDVVALSSTGVWSVCLATDNGLAAPVTFATWNPARNWTDVQIGDFNGNGKADVFARTTDSTANTELWVGLSTGSAFTSTNWATWITGTTTYNNVQVGDFNGDGKSDIFARTNTGKLYVGMANAAGTAFSTRLMTTWSATGGWTNVLVGDINGDGKADVIGRTSAGVWSAALTNSTGTASTTYTMGTWTTGITYPFVGLGDVNGDGKADLIARGSNGQWYAGIINADATTGFTTRTMANWSATSTAWTNDAVLDLNGDGKMDVLSQVTGQQQWWLGRSTGTAFCGLRVV